VVAPGGGVACLLLEWLMGARFGCLASCFFGCSGAGVWLWLGLWLWGLCLVVLSLGVFFSGGEAYRRCWFLGFRGDAWLLGERGRSVALCLFWPPWGALAWSGLVVFEAEAAAVAV